MSVDSENGLLSNEELHLFDDENSREIMSGIILKKGPWTSAEDAILIDYVNKHGEGNWNDVQKHSGLFRCGKSCRLRWANHLRPNLRKGPFTTEEEQLIIELHAKMGNKWARMASYLPGRTDNEIKNYWNTRIKRRQRAGLSLYPQEACFRALLDGTGDDPMMINSRSNGYSNTSIHAAPDVNLHNMSASHDSFPNFPELACESPDGMLFEAIGSSRQNNFASSHKPKHYCGSGCHECELEVIVKNELFPLEAAQDDPLVKSTGFIFPYDLDPDDHNWSPGIQESHSFVHGNFSTPKPTCEAVKSELPSFQYPDTDSSNWNTSYAASPLLDPNETAHSEYSSPHNSGLLDALLYEARTISGVKNQSSKKSSTSSAVTPPFDFADEISPKFCKTEIRINSEPVSPLNFATSIYSGSEFTARGTLRDIHPILETYSECKVKCEPIDRDYNPFEENILATFNSSDPGKSSSYTNWLQQESCFTANQTTSTFEEAVAEALESSNVDFGYMGSTVPGQGWGVGACTWNTLATVRKVSNLP